MSANTVAGKKGANAQARSPRPAGGRPSPPHPRHGGGTSRPRPRSSAGQGRSPDRSRRRRPGPPQPRRTAGRNAIDRRPATRYALGARHSCPVVWEIRQRRARTATARSRSHRRARITGAWAASSISTRLTVSAEAPDQSSDPSHVEPVKLIAADRRAGAHRAADLPVSPVRTWNSPPGYSRPLGQTAMDRKEYGLSVRRTDNFHRATGGGAASGPCADHRDGKFTRHPAGHADGLPRHGSAGRSSGPHPLAHRAPAPPPQTFEEGGSIRRSPLARPRFAKLRGHQDREVLAGNRPSARNPALRSRRPGPGGPRARQTAQRRPRRRCRRTVSASPTRTARCANPSAGVRTSRTHRRSGATHRPSEASLARPAGSGRSNRSSTPATHRSARRASRPIAAMLSIAEQCA